MQEMINRAMADKLRDGRCIDIAKCVQTRTGEYVLAEFTDDTDYCDYAKQAWVWSVGKLLKERRTSSAAGDELVLAAGTFLAALDSRFYTEGKSTDVECVWLR